MRLACAREERGYRSSKRAEQKDYTWNWSQVPFGIRIRPYQDITQVILRASLLLFHLLFADFSFVNDDVEDAKGNQCKEGYYWWD